MVEGVGVIYLAAFTSAYVTILLKVFQQKNVVGNHYKAVFITSNLLALSETVIILIVVHNGLWAGLATGVGAGLGAMTGMWLHGKIISHKTKEA